MNAWTEDMGIAYDLWALVILLYVVAGVGGLAVLIEWILQRWHRRRRK